MTIDVPKIARSLTKVQQGIVRNGGFSGDFTMATVRALKRKDLFYHALTSPNGRCGPMVLTGLGERVQAHLKEQAR